MTNLVSLKAANLRQLRDCVDQLIAAARLAQPNNFYPECVYLDDEIALTLVERKLSDGSAVLDITLRAGS